VDFSLHSVYVIHHIYWLVYVGLSSHPRVMVNEPRYGLLSSIRKYFVTSFVFTYLKDSAIKDLHFKAVVSHLSATRKPWYLLLCLLWGYWAEMFLRCDRNTWFSDERRGSELWQLSTTSVVSIHCRMAGQELAVKAIMFVYLWDMEILQSGPLLLAWGQWWTLVFSCLVSLLVLLSLDAFFKLTVLW
jgi:hypothetical protein